MSKGKDRELASLLFCILFSLSSLIWNSNFIVSGIARFQSVGNFFSSSLDNFGSFFTTIYTKLESFESVRRERDSCLAVMEDYKQLPQDLDKLKQENSSLRAELKFQPSSVYKTLKAEVYSIRLHSIFRTIIISKGAMDGIKPYMPVVARATLENGEFIQAVVGKIIAVNENTSIVEPLVNANFKMGVSIPGINFWAILSGNSGRGIDVILNYIDQGVILDPKVFDSYHGPEPFKVKETANWPKVGLGGDSKASQRVVFSSGSGGIFPPGIPVGEIIEEGERSGSFKNAYVRPFVRFENLQYVTVILKTPEEWIKQWPQEKNIQIETPYFGQQTFPDEKQPTPTLKPSLPTLTPKPVDEKPFPLDDKQEGL